MQNLSAYSLTVFSCPQLSQPALDFPSSPPAPALSVPQIVGQFIGSREQRGVSAAYLEVLRASHRRITALLPGPAAGLTVPAVEAFLMALGRTPVTQNNYLRLLRMAFRWGRRRRLLPAWADGPDLVEPRIEPPGEVAIYSPDELAALLSALAPAAVPVAVLVAFCGLRVAEACRLAWTHVDFECGHVLVPAARAKTRSRRLAPLTEAGAAWLRAFKDNDCLQSLSLWPGSRQQWAGQWREAHRRTGLPGRRNGLRHSFISYRLALVGDENQVALEAGNSPAVIFASYRAVARPETASKWFDLQTPSGLAAAA